MYVSTPLQTITFEKYLTDYANYKNAEMKIDNTFSRSNLSCCACFSAISALSRYSSSSFRKLCILSLRAFSGAPPATAAIEFGREFIVAILVPDKSNTKMAAVKTGCA